MAQKTDWMADNLSARAKTTALIMNATGWNKGIINPDKIGTDSIFFYVLDYETKWIWCCSIPRDSFFEAINHESGIKSSDASCICAYMIKQASCSKSMSLEKENDLAIALTCYIKITQSYQLTDCAKNQNHFAVIRYGANDILRPFAMGGPARHLIDAEHVQDALEMVVSMDLKNHPEWVLKASNKSS